MTRRRCPKCRKTGMWDGANCPSCKKKVRNAYDSQPERMAYKANRYDAEHIKRRRNFAPLVDAGVINCGRCQRPITSAYSPWHLDHLPNGTSWPAHSNCNLGAVLVDRHARLRQDIDEGTAPGLIDDLPDLPTPSVVVTSPFTTYLKYKEGNDIKYVAPPWQIPTDREDVDQQIEALKECAQMVSVLVRLPA